jgi:DNA-binding MarR family transcriptional regulator
VSTNENYDLQILNHIEENPETTQADLATQLGVAVGSVNWYIKRLVNKGYIKVTRMQRRRLKYLLTPQGMSEKARLTREFIQASLKWYRLTREDTTRYLKEARQAGYERVSIQGDGDLAEIIYLTCLEHQMQVVDGVDPTLPLFRIENWRVAVDWPAAEPDPKNSQTQET